MENCIFCKIVAGEIPAEKVYEDADYLAFMDIHPQSAGHIQVIPKKHYRYVWDVPATDIPAYFVTVQKLAKAIQKAFGIDAVFSKVMGDEVHHAHVWLFPNPYESTTDAKDFHGNAEKIKEALL